MGIVATGFGFWAQSLLPSAEPNHLLIDAMLSSPPPAQLAKTHASAAVDGVAAMRATRQNRGLALVEPTAAGTAPAMEVRVALLPQAPSITLSADSSWQLLRSNGVLLHQGRASEPHQLTTATAPTDVWVVSRPGAAVRLNGVPYEGRLQILNSSDGLQVVNHLPLESYVASVVGAEMPSSWSMEALKAQAVAARSYALAHMARPASRHWHLGNTTRWQAYRGLNSTTQRTRDAVAATSHLILSYQGGIVESLYAATSEISQEAHGHLGASMSQNGAQELARRGMRYNEILGRYYQGASLARLRQRAT